MLTQVWCGRLAVASLLFGLPAVASAAEPAAPSSELAGVQNRGAPQTPPPAEPPAKSRKWEFATIGYVWFAGAWGKTDVIGPAEPVDLKLPFGKVLKAFKFAFMG